MRLSEHEPKPSDATDGVQGVWDKDTPAYSRDRNDSNVEHHRYCQDQIVVAMANGGDNLRKGLGAVAARTEVIVRHDITIFHDVPALDEAGRPLSGVVYTTVVFSPPAFQSLVTPSQTAAAKIKLGARSDFAYGVLRAVIGTECANYRFEWAGLLLTKVNRVRYYSCSV